MAHAFRRRPRAGGDRHEAVAFGDQVDIHETRPVQSQTETSLDAAILSMDDDCIRRMNQRLKPGLRFAVTI